MKQLWMLIAVAMILLGIDRQLDLQSLLIQKIRDRAYANGWYTDRRRYQVDFIAAVSVAGVFVTIGLAIRLRRVFTRVALAIAGLAMVVLFVAIRGASFHYIDEALSFGKEFRVSAVIELSGIGLIIGAAMLWQQAERRDRKPPLYGDASAGDLSFPPPSIAERIS